MANSGPDLQITPYCLKQTISRDFLINSMNWVCRIFRKRVGQGLENSYIKIKLISKYKDYPNFKKFIELTQLSGLCVCVCVYVYK